MADDPLHKTTDRMRTPAEMVAALRALGDHLRTLDSGSPEAALMNDAANYIEGATASLREHMALSRKRGGALRDLIAWGARVPAPNDAAHRAAGFAAFDKAKEAMRRAR